MRTPITAIGFFVKNQPDETDELLGKERLLHAWGLLEPGRSVMPMGITAVYEEPQEGQIKVWVTTPDQGETLVYEGPCKKNVDKNDCRFEIERDNDRYYLYD